MIVFSRQGWLVSLIWVLCLWISSELVPKFLVKTIPWMPVVPGIFLLASVISSPLIGLLGVALNQEKVERKIKTFGKERTVRWGTHTFYMLPIEYWAFVIPIVTVVSCAVAVL